jgi:ATP-dependent DNA helicase RecG
MGATPSPRADDPVTVLKGVGPKTADAMAAEGVLRVYDLLFHLPRRYEDRSRLTTLDSPLQARSWVLVRGRVEDLRVRRISRRRLHIVDGRIDDGHGSLRVVWFNQRWLGKRLADAPELYLYGQIREARGGGLELLNPEIENVGEESGPIVPVYPALAGFGGRRMRRIISQCLPAIVDCPDPLPDDARLDAGVPGLAETLRELHAPTLPDNALARKNLLSELNRKRSRFHRRLAFDEVLAFGCAMAADRELRRRTRGPRLDCRPPDPSNERALLSFALTGAQRRVLGEICRDFQSGTPMARLVQGDVGSGKTAVAALAMLMALEGGVQVAMMAPTEILATQHFRTLGGILTGAGFEPRLLVASLPAAERRAVVAGLVEGSVPLVVGTHALFQEAVEYRRLGLVVVDEQHRFGVVERTALVEKGRAPHLLVMTATPIPRSLALTVYGDLELSVIDEMPPGRRPVRTVQRAPSARHRVFEFLRKEISQGGRGFVVYPLIDASDEIAAAALSEQEGLVRKLLPGIGIGVLHGRLTRVQQEAVSEQFREGSVQVVLATTVVEVGVDIPEATVMVIESAQRFGLSQLHQLRGRVGRGERPAWCVLLTEEQLSDEAMQRMEVMCRTTDGFEIAEADLEIRGPGELTGTRQWGPEGFRFANLVLDRDLIIQARTLATRLATSGRLDGVRDALTSYHPTGPGWRAS